MMKEWFPRHQWSINGCALLIMLSRLLCGERGKKWSVLLLAREEVKRENVLSYFGWSALLLEREEAKREWEWLAQPFILPGEVTWAEWHWSFSLDEICKSKTPTAKTIPALNNDLKLFLLHLIYSFSILLCLWTLWYFFSLQEAIWSIHDIHHHVAQLAWISLTLSHYHCSQEVFQATSCIGTELLYISSSRSSYFCSSMWRVPLEYIAYGFVIITPAVSHMSGSSTFDSFHDGC